MQSRWLLALTFVGLSSSVVGCGSDEPVSSGRTGLDDAGRGGDGDGDAGDGDGDGDFPQPTNGVGGLGDRCASAGDCNDGLTCLEFDEGEWLGGGPAGGYCTVDCSEDVAVCADFDQFGLCIQGATESEAYCFEGCFRGAPLVGETKCHNRAEVACTDFGGGASACTPTCGSDADCGDLFCDLELGVCVDDEPTGKGIGDECDGPEDDSCEGFCLNFGPVDEPFYECTALCTFGALGCGLDPTVPAQRGDALCLPLFGLDDTVGDAGLCIQRCDCNDDCLHEGAVCDPFNDAEFEEALEAKGFCIREALAVSVDGGPLGLACEGGGGDDGGMSMPEDAGNASTPDAATSTPDAATTSDAAADGG